MNLEFWDKARAYHGHECPGLAIGVKICEAVVEKMNVSPAFNEELVCITENDACGVDAIQALMNCTIENGNLIYNNNDKQVFTVIKYGSGQCMRFSLKIGNKAMERRYYQEYLLSASVDDLFDCEEVSVPLP
ncbi:MAG: formylmethanofuran dehydrogenase subunit E family protein [Dehalococcoidia bacterium]|nr:formylmethanofuran dehydrogenase subunit E family protein [Dehalococcoidia bacterium]